MKEGTSKRGSRGSWLRLVLVALGGLLALTGVAVLSIVWKISGDIRRGTQVGKFIHPLLLETPFTLGRGITPKESAETLQLPVYPGAWGRQSTLLKWVRKPASKPEIAAGLDLLQFHSEGPQARVEKWYRERLGPNFARINGDFAQDEVRGKDWLAKIPGEMSSEAVLFQHEEGGGLRGVLLQPQAEGDAMRVTLFYYTETRRR